MRTPLFYFRNPANFFVVAFVLLMWQIKMIRAMYGPTVHENSLPFLPSETWQANLRHCETELPLVYEYKDCVESLAAEQTTYYLSAKVFQRAVDTLQWNGQTEASKAFIKKSKDSKALSFIYTVSETQELHEDADYLLSQGKISRLMKVLFSLAESDLVGIEAFLQTTASEVINFCQFKLGDADILPQYRVAMLRAQAEAHLLGKDWISAAETLNTAFTVLNEISSIDVGPIRSILRAAQKFALIKLQDYDQAPKGGDVIEVMHPRAAQSTANISSTLFGAVEAAHFPIIVTSEHRVK